MFTGCVPYVQTNTRWTHICFSCDLHSNPCKYNTRNKAQYITHHCKTTVAQQSFFNQGPFIWNSLPANLKISNQTFKCFRNNLKKFVLKDSI